MFIQLQILAYAFFPVSILQRRLPFLIVCSMLVDTGSIGSGQTYESIWLRQDAFRDNSVRSDIYFWNPLSVNCPFVAIFADFFASGIGMGICWEWLQVMFLLRFLAYEECVWTLGWRGPLGYMSESMDWWGIWWLLSAPARGISSSCLLFLINR